jgi:GNAT superfamily N-acetyltransferase
MCPASTLRRALASDSAAIAALCVEHAQYEQARLVEPPDAAKIARALAGRTPLLQAWIVETEGGAIGFASGSFGYCTWQATPQYNLDCLYLIAGYRGLGLGRKMMDAVRIYAGSCGCTHVEWVTPPWNANAITFYTAIGAQAQDRIRFRRPCTA